MDHETLRAACQRDWPRGAQKGDLSEFEVDNAPKVRQLQTTNVVMPPARNQLLHFAGRAGVSNRRVSRAQRPATCWSALALALGISNAAIAAPPPTDHERVSAGLLAESQARLEQPRDNLRLRARDLETDDASKLPELGPGTVQTVSTIDRRPFLLDWSGALATPPLQDHHRRVPAFEPAIAFGDTLRPGERYAYEVSYSGNPAGFAEIKVAAREADPRGNVPDARPVLRVEGDVRTSGVLSLLASVTDHMVTWVDAVSGSPVRNLNLVDQSGVSVKYRHRETDTEFLGRGHARITDTKDDKTRRLVRIGPPDTFDPISGIAWVRALNLEPGQRARAHGLDGSILLRIDVVNRGPHRLKPMPSIASALGISPDAVELYEGVLTRVDRYDEPIPGKRTYQFRAWVARTQPVTLLALESDMWLGVIRITLSQYDPPTPTTAPASGNPQPTENAAVRSPEPTR